MIVRCAATRMQAAIGLGVDFICTEEQRRGGPSSAVALLRRVEARGLE